MNFYKFFLMPGHDLSRRYGRGSWAMITGADGGQARLYAHEFAARGFNLILIGFPGIEKTKQECVRIFEENKNKDLSGMRARVSKECLRNFAYPEAPSSNFASDAEDAAVGTGQSGILIKCIHADFSRAFREEEAFFEPIRNALSEIGEDNLAILMNVVGHRYGWIPYHEWPVKKIYDCITVKTLIQVRLTHMCIPIFVRRKARNQHSAVVNITGQCQNPTWLFSVGQLDSWISLPFLSIYEAANAFSFYHSQSLYEEYKGQFDFLTIPPGAVYTENTAPAFANATGAKLQACSQERFCANVIRFMGKVHGMHSGYWVHGFSMYAMGFNPFFANMIKKSTTMDTGRGIAKFFMEQAARNPESIDYVPPPYVGLKRRGMEE
eukprot:CAMPEP_0117475838 /NCGR_PEP_ID=MMETSP0784-20121206/10002_1 /TAXON_ID=39447 /ORGANISM="" /LENGTH=379 /DNA_ID=CAMNT_0005270099 /DNA_START=147 /DNA_END=1286 /DNA_ORIENTATION=+